LGRQRSRREPGAQAALTPLMLGRTDESDFSPTSPHPRHESLRRSPGRHVRDIRRESSDRFSHAVAAAGLPRLHVPGRGAGLLPNPRWARERSARTRSRPRWKSLRTASSHPESDDDDIAADHHGGVGDRVADLDRRAHRPGGRGRRDRAYFVQPVAPPRGSAATGRPGRPAEPRLVDQPIGRPARSCRAISVCVPARWLIS